MSHRRRVGESGTRSSGSRCGRRSSAPSSAPPNCSTASSQLLERDVSSGQRQLRARSQAGSRRPQHRSPGQRPSASSPASGGIASGSTAWSSRGCIPPRPRAPPCVQGLRAEAAGCAGSRRTAAFRGWSFCAAARPGTEGHCRRPYEARSPLRAPARRWQKGNSRCKNGPFVRRFRPT